MRASETLPEADMSLTTNWAHACIDSSSIVHARPCSRAGGTLVGETWEAIAGVMEAIS
jgi:hypothetical protein